MKMKYAFFLGFLALLVACSDQDAAFPGGLSDFDANADTIGERINTDASTPPDDIIENPFIKVEDEATSTFSVDADGAAYSNLRQHLNMGQIPANGFIRTEELINYFNYDYPDAESNLPIALNGEVSTCPWNPEHQLVRIGIQGKSVQRQDYPASNLVFLIDVSGSMNNPERLPMLQRGFIKYVDQLRDIDRVAIATYAGSAGLVLESTSGADKETIKEAIRNLSSGGSTNGEGGIIAAYDIAQANYVEGGNNRVIVASDGYFNVGNTSEQSLVELIEEKRELGIFLTILGVGTNFNEGTLEQIANNGNGNFEFLDNDEQLDKVFINEYNKFFTVAKDVKVQVEFKRELVKEYRLIGYENRVLANEEFEDDEKDAGEIGAGQSITAFYEIIPVNNSDRTQPAFSIDFRYKHPDVDVSEALSLEVFDEGKSFSQATPSHRFAASVASFGLLLRDSEYKGDVDYDKILSWANGSKAYDPFGYKNEFIELVERAKNL